MTTRKSTSLPDSSRRQRHCAVVDRISDLPDSILSHILSFLPTKDAVATTILSKRWDLLWTTTVNLDFFHPDYTQEVEFTEFVSYVLLLHKPGYLNRFSLEWTDGESYSIVNTWISAVITRNVHEIYINVEELSLPIRMQTRMFSCESLRSLELDCSICISNEIVVSLPNLQSLTLTSIYFEGEKAFGKILNGCPVLKYLVIHMDFGEMIQNGHFDTADGIAFTFIISSTTLEHLELDVYDEYPTPGLCGVQLDAPSLPYIKLKDSTGSLFIQKRLVFLGEANLQLKTFRQEPGDFNSFVEAFHAFSCAKTLILSNFVIWKISCATIKMRTKFKRLTRLEVLINWNYWSSLQDFIKQSRNLEVLIVNKDDKVTGDHLTNSNWKTPTKVPRCLSKCLRIVSIGAYNGNQDTLAMVGYILKHGSVLHLMKICFDESIRDLRMKLEMVQKISKFPRKSPDCELEFC